MIAQLNEDQLEKIPYYRDKWINIGLSTEPVTLERAIEIIHPLQTEILGRKKTPVVLVDNPLRAWFVVCLLADSNTKDSIEDQSWKQVMDRVETQVESQVRDKVWSQVEDRGVTKVMTQVSDQVRIQSWRDVGSHIADQVYNHVRDTVRAEFLNKIWNEIWPQVDNLVVDQIEHKVRNQVAAKVSSQVGWQVRDHVSSQVSDFILPWIVGQWGAGLFGFYDFFLNETDIGVSDEVRRRFDIWSATSELGLIYPLEHVAVVCQKPKEIYKNEHGLHREGGMAVEYEGWGFYALNGVRVPEYLAMTPSEELDIQFFHDEKNADVRTEFVRKYGVERMLSLGKKIDSYENYDEEWWTKSEYELWDMAALFPNLNYQPYLKMMNQTTKVWHVEAVSPNCVTLRDAIKERFGGRDFTIKAIT